MKKSFAIVLLLAMVLDACHQQSLRETRFPGAENGGGNAPPRGERGRRRRRSARGESPENAGAGVGTPAVEPVPAEEKERTGRRRRRRGSRRAPGESPARDAAITDE